MVREGLACRNLGDVYQRQEDFKTAIGYYERFRNIAEEEEDSVGVADVYYRLGQSIESLGSKSEALDCYKFSVEIHNDVRNFLQFEDDWKINLQDKYQAVYHSLWRLLLEEGKDIEALLFAEKGRVQALKDLMKSKYKLQTNQINHSVDRNLLDVPSNTVFLAFEDHEILFWAFQNKGAQLRRKQISDATSFFQSLKKIAYKEMNVRGDVNCEDRSLDNFKDNCADEKLPTVNRQTEVSLQKSALRSFCDTIIDPIKDLFLGNELVFVPKGPLCLVPFAAFMDSNSKYLCESFKLRVIPSLTSLKLIMDCPADFHSKSGALLVGDPWVQGVPKLKQLPCARREVEMIGEILNISPLIGTEVTKDEVLKRLPSVALVHIAAHGRMETGAIALASRVPVPKEKDYLLTLKDVSSVQMQARLVVLSCCHSARGVIKAEGVDGIARAFLGAGARSVLVSLWAISDAATLEFMKRLYRHLVKGNSASEALNQAMNSMRESDEFSAAKYWAPFVLIVTLKFGGHE